MQKSNKSYKINIKNPVYCVVTADNEAGTTYGEVKSLGEAQEISITPSVATGALYGNGAQVDSSSKLTGIAISLQTTKVLVEARQEIFNEEVTDGVVITKAGQNANYIALGYEVEQTDGKSQYVWLLKGRPVPMNESISQSTDNITYSTDTIDINFVRRDSDNALRYFADASNPDFTDEQAAAWFVEGPSNPVPATSTQEEE